MDMLLSKADLPDDLVIEILARLPVRSLVRFKCVAKSWLALSRDRSFINKHLNLATSSKSSRLLLYYDNACNSQLSTVGVETPEPSMDVTLHFRTRVCNYKQVLGPCNGVFCLLSSFRQYRSNSYSHAYEVVLWNPATRETKHLPQVMPRYICWKEHEYNFGFGIDPNTNDFKVVQVFEISNSKYVRCVRDEVVVEVYDLSSDSWRRIPTGLDPLVGCDSNKARCSLNGVQYWLTDCRDHMLSFHFGKEVFRWILLPPAPKPHYDCLFAPTRSLAVSNGSLLSIVQLPDSHVIWVMDGTVDKVSWTKLHELRVNQRFGVPKFLTVWVDDVIFEEVAFQPRTATTVWSYNLTSHERKTLRVTATVTPSVAAFPYTETLVVIDGGRDF